MKAAPDLRGLCACPQSVPVQSRMPFHWLFFFLFLKAWEAIIPNSTWLAVFLSYFLLGILSGFQFCMSFWARLCRSFLLISWTCSPSASFQGDERGGAATAPALHGGASSVNGAASADTLELWSLRLDLFSRINCSMYHSVFQYNTHLSCSTMLLLTLFQIHVIQKWRISGIWITEMYLIFFFSLSMPTDVYSAYFY